MKQNEWTSFMDMHSGGGLKEPPFHRIYIQAPKKEALVIFYNRFGHSALRVTCTCCGEDYSIKEADSLEHITGYERGCKYDAKSDEYVEEPSDRGPYLTLDQYVTHKDVLFIFDREIKNEWRIGKVPEQGYVWQ